MSSCASMDWEFWLPEPNRIIRFNARIEDTVAPGVIEVWITAVNGQPVEPPIRMGEGVCNARLGQSYMCFNLNIQLEDSTVIRKYILAGFVTTTVNARINKTEANFTGNYFFTGTGAATDPVITAADPGDTGTGGGSSGA